tara:strand:- start:184 stop:1278 length:1095 start_codon:yes stop_codon:yes gene_type:complete
MENKFKEYEKTIKKVHRFGWTPSYEMEFSTKVKAAEFIPIAERVIQNLGWDLIYLDDKIIEAKRSEKTFGHERWTEAISAKFEYGKIKVMSASLGNEMWDAGRNSKRVNLFVQVFKETENSISKEELQKIIAENSSKDNWEDYVLPETLPKPRQVIEPKLYIHLIGGVVLSILMAILLAKISINGIYIIGIFEFVVGVTIGFVFKYLIKLSNYTNFDKLHYVLIGVIGLTYLLNQYFQYELILFENNYDRIGFLEFMQLRFEQGLIIKNLNTGWIGLVISWILQIIITYYVSVMAVIRNLAKFQIERVPQEVIDFAFYNFIKGKTEAEVRKELALKGWTKMQNQDEVLEAIGALQTNQELMRMR